MKAGTLGKKTGKGIYDWSAGRPTIDLAKATKEYEINHLIALQVNEATKVLDEGIAESAAEIDLAIGQWRRLSFRSLRAGSDRRLRCSAGKTGRTLQKIQAGSFQTNRINEKRRYQSLITPEVN
jgi:hypothetical protein